MNISGLVYNNEESVAISSTGASNRGVMAPHAMGDGSSYVQMHHHHPDFETYPQGPYFEPHQVPQYSQQVGMISHPQQYHHPSAQYSIRQHPGQHPQHPQHPHQHQQAPQHQHQQHQHQQHPQQQHPQQHHGLPVGHQQHGQHHQHHHIQQAQQSIPRRGTPVQAMPQAIAQPIPRNQPSNPRELMNAQAGRTRSGMARNASNLSVKTQMPPSNALYPYPAPQPQPPQQQAPTPPLPSTQRQQVQQQQQQQQAPPIQISQQQQPHRPQNIHIPPHNQPRPQQQQHHIPPSTPQTQQNPAQSSSNPPSASPNVQSPLKSATQVEFKTDVDTLMKAIQAKESTVKAEKSELNSPYSAKGQMSPTTPGLYPRDGFGQYGGNGQFNQQMQVDAGEQGPLNKQKQRKRYPCTFEGCSKSFFQKTHLDIHIRAHSGDKPYPCKEPGCGQRFSQMGNLKTHQRRHTGEKPFECEKCHKRFAQRGNVRAHRIVHEGIKPFTCRLENCNKQFTQLGNLKSHQNKFHAENLRMLTQKFATIQDTEGMTRADRELFEYFAELYKNSNRGIKGRGKDRKIVGSKKPKVDDAGAASGERHTSQDSSMSPGSDVNSVGMGHGGQGFEYADVDDESSVGSPFEQQHQPQLPPLRQGHHGMHDAYNVRAGEYGVYNK